MFDDQEKRYIETARVGRLATADTTGQPHVVPICFAMLGGRIVTPIDEKPQDVSPEALQRSRDIDENPQVAVIVDHYTEEWTQLGWIQIRGTATHLPPEAADHSSAVTALREKYDQYTDHALEDRPIVQISPESTQSWGQLNRPDETGSQAERLGR